MSKLGIANHDLYAATMVGLQEVFQQDLAAMGPDPLRQLAVEVKSAGSGEQYMGLGDVPGMREWLGDRVLGSLNNMQWSIANRDFSSGIEIHKNAIADDKLGLIRPRINTLAAKASRHAGDLMAKYLIQGFSGSAYAVDEAGDGLSWDGALFFSDAHAWDGSAAMSNKMTAALTEANLEAADLKLQSFSSWDGKDPLDIQGTHLFVGPKLYATAVKLIGSELLANAAGTAAPSNAFLRNRYTIVRVPRLIGAYDDYWFLADLSKGGKPFIFQNREEVSTWTQVDTTNEAMFMRGNIRFGAQARYGIGYYDWRLVVGSMV